MGTGDETVVFISSSMAELKAERAAVRATIEEMQIFEPFVFEHDAVAHAHSAKEEYRRKLEGYANVTILLVWKQLGEYTKDEIEVTRQLSIPLLFFRKLGESGEPLAIEDALLDELNDAEAGVTARFFGSIGELKSFVYLSLASFVKDLADAGLKNVRDDAAVAAGDGRVGEVTAHGVSVQDAASSTVPKRPVDELRQLPPNTRPFVGRVDEKAKLKRAVESGDEHIVTVVGPPGVGKKALLKEVTHHVDFDSRFEDGVAVYPDVIAQDGLEDVLQAIWEEFYDVDDPSEVVPRKRNRQLGRLSTLIFLPGVKASVEGIEQLPDTMPGGVFCFTAERGALPGARIPVSDFTDPEEMVSIFEGPYHGEVPDAARDDVASICAALGGNPYVIELAAARAWEEAEYVEGETQGDHPLPSWAATHRQKSTDELLDWLVPPEVQRAVAVAAAVRVAMPEEVMTGVGVSEQARTQGVDSGLIEKGSPRYRANAAVAPRVDDDEVMAEVFENGLVWAEEAGTSDIFANREFVLRMLEWGSEQERWTDVIRLGRATEAAMALGGRHGAWEEVLQHASVAARSMEPVDVDTHAWALHQLGSRALLRDDLRGARVLLHKSLAVRPDTSPSQGRPVETTHLFVPQMGRGSLETPAERTRELTRRNLRLVPMAIVPVAVLFLWLVVIAAWTQALRPPVPNVLDVDALTVDFTVPVSAPAVVPTVVDTGALRAVSGGPIALELAIEDEAVDGETLDPADVGFCIVEGEYCVGGSGGSASPEPARSESTLVLSFPVIGQPLAQGADEVEPCPVGVTEVGTIEVTVPQRTECDVQVGFQPRQSGSYEATLVATVKDDGSRYSGTLKGTGEMLAEPISEIEPDVGRFDRANDELMFRIANVGTASFYIAPVEDWMKPEGFEVIAVGNSCDGPDGHRLEPAQSCSFTVTRTERSESGFLNPMLSSRTPGLAVSGDLRVLLLAGS